MSQLIKLGPYGPHIARALPANAFKAAAAPNSIPVMAIVNAGQGDGRPKIKPNVPWPSDPSVTHWEGGAFVRLSEWLDRANIPSLSTADGIALVLTGDENPMLLQGHLDGIGLIAIDFARFSDGRGQSLAHLIRTRLHWRKEVRAVGDVLIDQLFFMARCGFDAFALREGQDVARALEAFNDFPFVYQANADRRDFAMQAPVSIQRKAA
jgi:uncharacterized protein (DUF934 family)